MIGLDNIWCIGTGKGNFDFVISKDDFHIQIKCVEGVANLISRAKTLEAEQTAINTLYKMPRSACAGCVGNVPNGPRCHCFDNVIMP